MSAASAAHSCGMLSCSTTMVATTSYKANRQYSLPCFGSTATASTVHSTLHLRNCALVVKHDALIHRIVEQYSCRLKELQVRHTSISRDASLRVAMAASDSSATH
eukprot:4614948-Amphidinium_carterae.2